MASLVSVITYVPGLIPVTILYEDLFVNVHSGRLVNNNKEKPMTNYYNNFQR